MSIMTLPLPVAAPPSVAAVPAQDGGLLALRTYQREAIEAIGASGMRRPIVALPTGTGKTVIFAHLIAEVARRGERALVLVHRDELVGQTLAKLSAVAPGLEVGVVKAERDERRAAVVVASAQTLARRARLERLVPDFALVVVDEAHHAPARSWRRALEHLGCLGCLGPAGPLTVGFTATPERADGASLAAVFEGVVYQRDILSMIRAGYLCDVRGMRLTLQANLDHVHSRGGDFAEGELAEEMARANAPVQVVAGYLEHAAGRKALAFLPSVRLAEQTAALLEDAGVRAALLSAHTPLPERRAILRDLSAGRVQVVANCGVLTEGFDEPSVDCLLLARPTHSRPLYVQMVGRVLRTFPGKECALVLDFVGASTRHQLITLASLLPVDGEQSVKKTEQEAAQREEARRVQAREGEEAEQASLLAQDVDLLGRATLHWARGDGRAAGLHVLALPAYEALLLSPEPYGAGDSYEVLRLHGDVVAQTVAGGLPLAWAQGAAEDWARSHAATGLARQDAGWRERRPPTEKTLRHWDRAGRPRPADMTQGRASDLIALGAALRALRRRAAQAEAEDQAEAAMRDKQDNCSAAAEQSAQDVLQSWEHLRIGDERGEEQQGA